MSFDVHLDEAQIHAHSLILPLRDGRMCGSDLVGNRQTLAAHHQSFHEVVGSSFGLRRAKGRLVGSNRMASTMMVMQWLKTTDDATLRSKVWPAIRACIENDSRVYLETLGLELVEPGEKLARSFVQIMTKPQRLE